MEIKEHPYTETYTVTKSRDTYVSFDGIEFENSTDCIRHEEEIVEKLEIPRISGYVPMSIDAIDKEDGVSWYVVRNDKEFENILSYYGMDPEDYYPVDEPEIICIIHGDYNEDVYTMKGALGAIKSFLAACEEICKSNPVFAAIYDKNEKEN